MAVDRAVWPHAINAYNDGIDCKWYVMASITIRNLDSALKERLRVRAAQHGHSMEQEARDLLRVALNRKIAARRSLHDKINERFGELGGVELPKLKRQAMRGPIEFTR